MLHTNLRTSLIVVTLLLTSGSSTIKAQDGNEQSKTNKRQNQNQQGGIQALNQQGLVSSAIAGKLMDTDGQILQLETEDKTMVYVQLPQRREGNAIEYRATLSVKQLQPGMVARFQVPFEKLQGPSVAVSSIDILNAEEIGQRKPRTSQERAESNPGVYPMAQLWNNPTSKDVLIISVIVGMKDNKLVLNAGDANLIVDVSDDTAFTYKSQLLHLAKKGDEVQGNGIAYEGQANRIQANRISIIGTIPEASAEGENVLSEKPSKNKRKSKRDSKLKPEDATAETQTSPEKVPEAGSESDEDLTLENKADDKEEATKKK